MIAEIIDKINQLNEALDEILFDQMIIKSQGSWKENASQRRSQKALHDAEETDRRQTLGPEVYWGVARERHLGGRKK